MGSGQRGFQVPTPGTAPQTVAQGKCPAPRCPPKGSIPPKCLSLPIPSPSPPPPLHLQRGSRVGRDATVVLSGNDAAGQRGPGHGAHSWERRAGRSQAQGPEKEQGDGKGAWQKRAVKAAAGRERGGAGAEAGGAGEGEAESGDKIGTRLGRGGEPTYLVEELRQLHLYLLPLEHVVLRLLADGRDQVELPGHGVGLLWKQRGTDGSCGPAIWGPS